MVKGRGGEGRRWGCKRGKRERVKRGEMKSRPQGERREKERDMQGGGRGDGQQGMKITRAKQRGKER